MGVRHEKAASQDSPLVRAACSATTQLFAAELQLGTVGPVPDNVRRDWRLDPFYQKHIVVAEFPIVGSSRVTDYAILEAAWILRHMLVGREAILRTLAAEHVHLTVMAYTEYTTDVPEQRNMKPRVFWDRRARGLGGNPVSCAEENVLCFPGDPYSKENILIHEFAHIIHGRALKSLDPTFEKRLKAAYENAVKKGLWHGTYAGTNRGEYWAEAVQSWFDDNRENDALHNHVNTRAELKKYDPALASLCAEVLGDGKWRYRKPLLRGPAGRTHLAGFDPVTAPHFRWREEPLTEKPRVLIQTKLGDIEVELDATRAARDREEFRPLRTRGFLQRRSLLPYGDPQQPARGPREDTGYPGAG